ncbi:hypothetical protein K431DRAFT_86932 [Polychaeton citri CBS 116435]|uniref:Uncharacterized protein n=1 Tax=Polychaeton citri CBS 116435 TaxID=1314669 RepID=A0A9P4UNJ9_9PEZI|nr:hypothetical protein K431DRAFT_86932 [Polychaeton citri CBS 116435]
MHTLSSLPATTSVCSCGVMHTIGNSMSVPTSGSIDALEPAVNLTQHCFNKLLPTYGKTNAHVQSSSLTPPSVEGYTVQSTLASSEHRTCRALTGICRILASVDRLLEQITSPS